MTALHALPPVPEPDPVNPSEVSLRLTRSASASPSGRIASRRRA